MFEASFFDRYGKEKFPDEIIPGKKAGYFAILVKNDKVLVTYPANINVPEFPGGSKKRGENFRECLFRKLYEETGIEFMLSHGEKEHFQTINYFAAEEKPHGNYYIYDQTFKVYDASAYGFDTEVPRWKTPENSEAEWVSIDDIFSKKIKINYAHWLAFKELF